jgi:DNA-binding transcriptional LysR family regulator
MVNLEWYRSFVEVYRVGTASGAAEVLHLTQPAVSQHLAALEAALGQPLFLRQPRRMQPTEAGIRLYTQVVAAIEKLESIATRILPADLPQTIRLGTPPEFFAEQILSQLPQTENLLYRIQFGLALELIDRLSSGQLDVVIATQKIGRSGLEYQLIAEENFWLVAPPATVIPIKSSVSQSDLTSLDQWIVTQPLIAYSEELPIIRRFWRVVFGRRLDITPKLVIPDLCQIRSAVAAGFGLSVLPDYLCEKMVATDRLTLILNPKKAVKNQLWLAYKKSDRQSMQVKLLQDLLVSRNETMGSVKL